MSMYCNGTLGSWNEQHRGSFEIRHPPWFWSRVAAMSSGTEIIRRNRPGTKREEWCQWPDEVFDEVDTVLAVQQIIQQMIRKDFKNVDAILTEPQGQDLGVWKYEHLRQFCMELNGLAVLLQDHCTPETCAQMTATEQWIFLCAAHKTPKEACPAINYTRHTLDGAACLLNSSKYFPSRVTIRDSSLAKLSSVCRRVYRIFSHAYYHHRSLFDQFEEKTALCQRFTVFVLKYNLMNKQNLLVPIAGADIEEVSSADGGSGGGSEASEATTISDTANVNSSV
ncbi:MOB-like protein phocein [Echinococcus granulosus]|nr:MOB-like protein phocein [Echinococcus granulosus]